MFASAFTRARVFVRLFSPVFAFVRTEVSVRACLCSFVFVCGCVCARGRGGPMDLVIYDIHALQERFYFGDNVIPVT